MFPYKNILLFFLLFIQFIYATKQQKNEITPFSSPHIFLKDFRENNYNLKFGGYFVIFDGTTDAPLVVKIHAVEGYNNCVGVTTPSNETILLKCPELESKDRKCVKIITWQTKWKYNNFSKDLTATKEIESICVTYVEPHHSGFRTSKGWILLYQEPRKRVIRKNIISNLPENNPIRRRVRKDVQEMQNQRSSIING